MPARARAQLAASGLAAGNGTVMRATPIGLAARDVRQAADAARRDAELTHADPVTGLASAALCAALLAIRHGGDPLQAAREQAAGHQRLSAATQAADATSARSRGCPPRPVPAGRPWRSRSTRS